MARAVRSSRIVVRVLGSIGALLGALFVAEGSVALFDPQPVGALTVPELLRGEFTDPGDHEVKSGEYSVTVHVNQHGFVDHEWGEKKGGRVVILGDSYVQAAQVPLDDGVGRVLERTLGSMGLAGADVLSMGVPGAGTATELGVLEKYAFPEHPDLVLLGFLVANDVLNNHPLLEDRSDKPFYTLQGGHLVKTDAFVMGSSWLWRQSHLVRRFTREAEERRISDRKIARGGGIPIDLHVYNPQPDATWEEAWKVTDALIAEISRRCEEKNIAFATVLFPDRDGALGHPEWPGTEAWDTQKAQSRAAAMAKKYGPVLDLSAEFAGHPELYFKSDGHWTAEGHHKAAEAMAHFVVDVIARRAVTQGMLQSPGR